MCGVPDDVFELLAPFAVTSGWVLATLPQLTTADLQTIAQNPDHARSFQDQFLFCYALDEREEMQNALVQAAAVSELSSRAEDHPAIDGCPGTGSTISDEEADEIEQLLPAESVEAAARLRSSTPR